MSKILNYIKKSNVVIPIPFGIFLSQIPFSYRPGIGTNYKKQLNAISQYKSLDIDNRKEYIFKEFFKVFSHAFINIPFYSDLYKNAGLSLSDIKSFEDIHKIPIISKKNLIEVPIEDRSFPIKNRLQVNTGGSSGKPLAFYMDPRRYGNEWAHIHHIWSKFGYGPSSLKLSFDGRSSVKDYIQYDFARNSLKVDIYADQNKVCEKLFRISQKYKIEFLHGYPSALSEFATNCQINYPELGKQLRLSLKGAFLNSEFPAPHYRSIIEDVFKIKTQSFYGHTETCVFAEEIDKFNYSVHQTYGYAEAILNDDLSKSLIGTSYFNFASPLIRYNTQDLIEVSSSNQGVLESFKIKEGRKGEYVLDLYNSKIPLTGLIFGRHHKLFDYCSHVQVKQVVPGEVFVYYVAKEELLRPEDFFDSQNVNINFKFFKLEKPILTSSGKINLLIK